MTTTLRQAAGSSLVVGLAGLASALRRIVRHFQVQAAVAAARGHGEMAGIAPLRDAVLHGIFDQRLQDVCVREHHEWASPW